MREEVENVIAAVCCALLGVVGVFVNGVCVILMLRIKSLSTSFGYLTAFHTLSNALLTSMFLLWVAPCILWDFSSAFEVNRTVGQLTIIAQAGAYFSMLLLSVNRSLCVFRPTKYVEIFTNRFTAILIAVFGSICLLYGCVYFDASCYFIFDRTSLQFEFSDAPCGQALSTYVDFWFSIVLFAFVCSIDFVTIIKLRMVIRNGSALSKYGNSHRFRRDLRFFAQTVCTTILFSLTVVCFHTVSVHFTTRFGRFCTTTVIWGMNHAGAGIIVVAFNKEVRANMLRPLWPNSSGSLGHPSTHQGRLRVGSLI